MSARIRFLQAAPGDVQTPPSGRASVFLDSTDNVLKIKKSDGSIIPLEQVSENIQDIIAGALTAGTGISITYDDAIDSITIESNFTDLDARYYTEAEIDAFLDAQNEASEITVTPSGNLVSTDVQSALEELQTDVDSLSAAAITDHSQLNLDDGTNPHGTTSADVGLGNVDNTSDVDKPISTAAQNALNLKANQADLLQEVANRTNGDTNLQTQITSNDSDIASLQTTVSDFETSAQLDARDTANRDRANHTGTQLATTISDLPTAVQALETTTTLTLASDTLTYVDEDGNSTAIDLSIYNDDTNLARIISASVDASGVLTFTRDDATSFTADLSSLLDNQSASDVPVTPSGNLASTDVQSALTELQSDIDTLNIAAITNHSELTLDDGTNPHNTTATDVGLGNVDNTSDADKPVSTAQQAALDLKSDSTHTHTESDITDLDKYTQAEVDAQQAAQDTVIDGKANLVHTHVESDITDLDKYTQAEVDAVETGLQSQITTNSSSITQEATDRIAADAALQAQIAAIPPETLTSLSISGNILTYTDEDGTDTTIDLSVYIDDTNLARLTSGVLDGTTGIATFQRDDASSFTVDMSALIDTAAITTLQVQLDAHEGDLNNPHQVTSTQVGLGNVDNTSDVDKPVSTPQQNALDLKADAVHTHVEADITDLDKYTQAEIDTQQDAQDLIITNNVADIASNLSEIQQNETDRIAADAALQAGLDQEILDRGAADTALQTDVDSKSPIGHTHTISEITDAATVAATGDFNDLINIPAPVAAPVDSVNGQIGVVVVTATDVGLGNVDNTSDVDKPISTATQTALDVKYDASNPLGFETPAELDSRDTANRDRTNHTGTQLAATISDFMAEVQASETVTSLSLNANMLSYTNEAGAVTNLDLSIYLDDSNLARLVSGTLDATTGIATFERDDASTFTLDLSSLNDQSTINTAISDHEAAADPHPQLSLIHI